jgi:hypothetical protein
MRVSPLLNVLQDILSHETAVFPGVVKMAHTIDSFESICEELLVLFRCTEAHVFQVAVLNWYFQ